MFPEMMDIASQMILKWDRLGPDNEILCSDDFTISLPLNKIYKLITEPNTSCTDWRSIRSHFAPSAIDSMSFTPRTHILLQIRWRKCSSKVEREQAGSQSKITFEFGQLLTTGKMWQQCISFVTSSWPSGRQTPILKRLIS